MRTDYEYKERKKLKLVEMPKKCLQFTILVIVFILSLCLECLGMALGTIKGLVEKVGCKILKKI